MVVVKVRETYDLKTTANKMTVIAIHTPKPDILVKNYPGLLMQCKMYRPLAADVRLACASVLPLDPLGIGTEPGDVAPEDVFNPILYKATSNKGMSQLEARINALVPASTNFDVNGPSASVEVDSFTSQSDEFGLYYGLLSNTNEWRHANPQSGLEMTGLRPLVYEMLYNVGDSKAGLSSNTDTYMFHAPAANNSVNNEAGYRIVGSSKPLPFMNCTDYTFSTASPNTTSAVAGFPSTSDCGNAEIGIPYIPVVCGVIIVPPSRLHSLYFRMVVEWSIEFSSIRPLSEITTFTGIADIGSSSHFQNYSYSSTKEAITGSSETILDNDACMVSTNADVKKVM